VTANNFLITGLPRSRTAWFSVAASQAPAMCWHEPIKTRWQDCFQLWNSSPYMWTGISDSSLGFHLPEIVDEIGPKIVIIERDPDEVKASLRAIGHAADAYVDLLHRHLNEFSGAMRVPFDATPDEVGQALSWAMPGLKIDLLRLHAINKITMNADLAHSRERASQLDPAEALGKSVIEELVSCR
jgi:hypothetical protein